MGELVEVHTCTCVCNCACDMNIMFCMFVCHLCTV